MVKASADVLSPFGLSFSTGFAAKRLDASDKVNGRAEFGIDFRLRGMKIAAIAISPVSGGKVAMEVYIPCPISTIGTFEESNIRISDPTPGSRVSER